MGGIERAAIYIPGFRRDGVAVAGPDEDEFTVAATALELLEATTPKDLPTPSVHLVGSFSPLVDWAVPAVLGRPVAVTRYPPGRAGLSQAREALGSAGSVRPSTLAVVDLPERDSGSPGSSSSGAVGWAVRFGSGPEGPLPPPTGGNDLATELRSWISALPVPSAARDEVPIAHPPASPLQLRPYVEASTGALSEGAYVPRPRYLENLPSRWRLEGVRCARCRTLTFPTREICRSCGAEEGLTVERLPRAGARVVAVTTIGKGGQPTEFDTQVEATGEYSVVLAEFAPGVRLTLQLADASPGEVVIGAPVGTRLRRLYPMEGEWRYGRKAVPLRRGAAAPTAR